MPGTIPVLDYLDAAWDSDDEAMSMHVASAQTRSPAASGRSLSFEIRQPARVPHPSALEALPAPARILPPAHVPSSSVPEASPAQIQVNTSAVSAPAAIRPQSPPACIAPASVQPRLMQRARSSPGPSTRQPRPHDSAPSQMPVTSTSSREDRRSRSRDRFPYEDDWRQFQVNCQNHTNWWDAPNGIIDSRLHYRTAERVNEQPGASEGTKLRVAFNICERALAEHPCQFKVGMARSLGKRWQMYRESDGLRPTHLWLLLRVRGREAIGYAEVALIDRLQTLDLPGKLNLNFKRKDSGGTGPRHTDQLHDVYFLYLAVNVFAIAT